MSTTHEPAPIASIFTPGEIECLVRTAAEAVCGNAIADETLSGLQVTLARRAWAVLMPGEPATPGQAPAPVPGATPPPPAETDQHRPSVLGGPCQVCGGECVTITWREDTCYQVTVHAADIAAVYDLFGEEPPAGIGCRESDAPMDELLGDYADDDHFISVDSRVITRAAEQERSRRARAGQLTWHRPAQGISSLLNLISSTTTIVGMSPSSPAAGRPPL